MNLKKKRCFNVAVCLLSAFLIWTAAVCFFDVKAIGPNGSSVGFAAMNGFVHEITGVNMTLYAITDCLGFIPIGFAAGFAVLGLAQWIKRKSVFKVDRDIIALGIFYIAVMAVYVFFEFFVINRRPVLINGLLEASYPSSTTMLTVCVMTTAALQLYRRIENAVLKKCAVILIGIFTVLMVFGRLISGVHWISDIIGGIFLSAGLVMAYCSFIFDKKQ